MSEPDEVPVSTRTGVPLDRTVKAFLDSNDDAKIEIGMNYLRRMFALLLFQFTAIGMIISPFCLIDWIKYMIGIPAIMLTVNFVSFVGLFMSAYAVAARGDEKWAARVGLFGATFFFAVALGAKLAMASWANYALVAVGQATAGFALVLAVLQFNSRIRYLTFLGSIMLCFAVACLWMLLMRESGCSWLVAATVPLGGWLFLVHLFSNARKSLFHREPDDYVRAVIFILGPPIPEWLICYRRRSARGRWATLRAQLHFHSALKENRRRKERERLTAATDYGAVDDSADQ